MTTNHRIIEFTNHRVGDWGKGRRTDVGGRRAGVRTQDSEDERMDG
jgi:hypothetical protein